MNKYLPIFNVIWCGCGQALPQLWLSKIFCGLRSLWTTPLAWSAFIAPANCFKNTLIVSSERVPFAKKINKKWNRLNTIALRYYLSILIIYFLENIPLK